MNNVNSQEISSRARVADGSTAQSNPTAKSGAQSGKVMPEASRAQEAKQAEHQAKASAQRADRVEQAVARLNDYVQSTQRDLRFSVDEDLGRTVVRVIDSNTKEIIRQIPNETALNLARNLKGQIEADLQAGEKSGLGSLGLINTRI